MAATTKTPKDEVRDLLNQLPDTATFEDIATEVEFRARIQRGLADIDAGRVYSVAEVRRRLGLEP